MGRGGVAVTDRTHWFAVYAAVACGVAVAINVGKVPISLDLLRVEFGLSLVSAGWVASMLSALAVFCALFIGVLCDRIGHLRMTGVGLSISIAATLAGVYVEDSGGLLLARFGEGVGFLIVVIAAPGLVNAATQPGDRRFALGVWATYLPVGVGLAMLVAPILLPLGGWRGLWQLSVICLALAGFAVYRCRQSYVRHRIDTPHTLRDITSAVSHPLPWMLGFALCLWAIQYFALIVWLPTFLDQYGISQGLASFLTASVVIAHAPGNLVGGLLVKRHWHRGRLIMLASTITTALSFVIYLDLLSDGLRYFACLALSFTGGLISASVLSSTEALAKSRRQIGTLQGLFLQIAHLGQFIGPPLIAALVARSGVWGDALWVNGSASITGIFLGMAIYAQEGRLETMNRTIGD